MNVKQIIFLNSSKEEICQFPDDVKREIGFALHLSQTGVNPLNAYPMTGFGSAAVREIIANHFGDTYRSVFTVRFEEVIYVLHAFKKKSKNGNSTPKPEMSLIKKRLKDAEKHYQEYFGKPERKKKNVGT
jgi:phage-related protein